VGAVKTKLVVMVSVAIMLVVLVACGAGLEAAGAFQPAQGCATITI